MPTQVHYDDRSGSVIRQQIANEEPNNIQRLYLNSCKSL
jgi:hypothetical protein